MAHIFRNGQPSHDGDRDTFRSADFNFSDRYNWFGSFFVSTNPLSRKP